MDVNITIWQQDNARHVLEQALKIVEACVPESQLPDVHTETLNSSVVSTLVHASENKQMIVVGSRGTGALGRLLLGSVSTGLVHHASCPVAVIRPEPSSSDIDAPVLLGIDGSPASEAATALAFDEASRREVGLVALHAWSDWGVFPILGMDWHEYKSQGHESWASGLPAGRNSIPTCMCSDTSSAISRPAGLFVSLSTPNWWWSAVGGVADSQAHGWVR